MSNPTTAITPFNAAKQFLSDPALLGQIKMACNKVTTPERIARIALTAVLSSPKLGQCFTTNVGRASIAKALLTCTQRGLEPDGRQAHLIPFNCKQPDGTTAMTAQYIPGYQGLADLAYNHPKVEAIQAEVVYEKDVFVYVKGLNAQLVHQPYEGDDDPGPLTKVYAICRIKGASPLSCPYVVLGKREIDKAKAFSRGATDPDSPWIKHEPMMWKKTAVRQLCKLIPQSNELRDVMEDDDRFDRETINVESSVSRVNPMELTAPEPPRSIAPPQPQATSEPGAEPASTTPPEASATNTPKRRGRPPKSESSPTTPEGQPVAESPAVAHVEPPVAVLGEPGTLHGVPANEPAPANSLEALERTVNRLVVVRNGEKQILGWVEFIVLCRKMEWLQADEKPTCFAEFPVDLADEIVKCMGAFTKTAAKDTAE